MLVLPIQLVPGQADLYLSSAFLGVQPGFERTASGPAANSVYGLGLAGSIQCAFRFFPWSQILLPR